jgi:predicted transcriptional regulator
MSKILLLSIKPQYAEKIFSGEKTVELRRTRPRLEDGDLVLVYTSSPRCALTGAFVVANVVTDTPEVIWRKYGSKAEIERTAFDAYYEGAKSASAIGIERAWTFDRAVTLNELRRRMKGFHPPQSYRYLAGATASSLIAKGAIQPPRVAGLPLAPLFKQKTH